MEIDQYQQRRRTNLRWGLGALLFGPILGSFVAGVVVSPYALNQLPYEPWVHSTAQWVAAGLYSVQASLGNVMLVQVLVWWVTWSIRELMVATLIIAIVIALFDALIRYQQQTIDAPLVSNLGWISLINTAAYCLTNLIVLWSAARYRLGGLM